MGKRGPKPGTGGRPKKPIAEKIAEGNLGKRPLTVIDFKDSAADLEGQPMPDPPEYLSATQKDGSTLCAAEIDEKVDLKSRLAIRRFFLLAKISGVKRSGRRMSRRRGASAPEAGQCRTALWQTYPAAVLPIENDIASQKRVFE